MAYTTINKSTDYFDTKLYTGGNGSATTISGLGFAPDFVWCKDREGTAVHALMDRLRSGGYGHGWVRSESSDAENNNSGRGNISSFTSDGYVLSADTWGASNEGTTNHVAWNWKAGGTGSANSNGTISSTVSANTTAGFSIVKYTGSGSGSATVGHGLGVKPKALMVKSRTNAENWGVWIDTTGNGTADKRLVLNGNAGDYGNYFVSFQNNTFTLPSHNDGSWSGSGQDYIAYCFAEKTGYSKFGLYTGNGSSDGTFVYTGFKPSIIIPKISSSTSNWRLFDNKRLGYNIDNNPFFPNTSSAEGADDNIDILSNGFKLRTTDSALNGSGSTYIYMAFGQSLVGSNNIPCTAR